VGRPSTRPSKHWANVAEGLAPRIFFPLFLPTTQMSATTTHHIEAAGRWCRNSGVSSPEAECWCWSSRSFSAFPSLEEIRVLSSTTIF